MKTEEVIRRRIEASKFALTMKCQCGDNGHLYECHVGAMMLKATIGVMEWALDVNPQEDRMYEELLTIVQKGGFQNT